MTDLTPILSAVRQAAILCRRIQQTQFARSEKGANDPVTIADYGVQAIICRALRRYFPDDAVISEEQGSQFLELVGESERLQIVQVLTDVLDEIVTQSDVVEWLDYGRDREAERTWVIDPIDGTKGFIALRRYSIAIGVLQNGYPVEGILGSPGHPSPDAMGVLFYTYEGGTVAEWMSGGSPRPVHVSNQTNMETLRIVESVVWQHTDMALAQRIRAAAGITSGRIEQMDSQDKYAMIASGEADLLLRLPRGNGDDVHYIWDHAAGVALVEAAGGKVTGLAGERLDFTTRRTTLANSGVIVTNGHIHDRIVQAVQATQNA